MSESIVKSLEWRHLYPEQTKWPKTWHGIGIFGLVVAVDQSFASGDFYCFGKGYVTLEEAKAAAQSGYEATVLSALSPSIASLQAENERLKAENERLLANASSNAKLLSSYHALLTKLSAAPSTSDLYAFRDYKPGTWAHVNTVDEMQEFYLSRLHAIRLAAHEHGYAIGVHGSQRRDFDLMAMQWREGASDKDLLAHAIAEAACGISQDGPYKWEQKPMGRVATSFPVCWTAWHDMISAGHIDLSLVPEAARAALGSNGND